MAYKRYQLPGPTPAQSYYVVDTAAETITERAEGDMKYAKDTDSIYTYDGSAWDAVGGGVTDHGALSGLGDDDHPQYLTEAEADALYEAIGGGGTDEIVWLFSSKVHPETGIGRRMYAPYDATIIRAYAWCTDTAPSSTMTADILLAGTSIGGTKPTVTAGNFLGAEITDMVTTAVNKYDKMEVEVEATGSADGRINVAVVVTRD